MTNEYREMRQKNENAKRKDDKVWGKAKLFI
jgi:hypothetical protein